MSDDALRLGLSQLIDGLERLDELTCFVEGVSSEWRRDGVGSRKDWEKETSWYASTPLVDRGEEIRNSYTASNAEGKVTEIGTLSRAELEAAVRESWESLVRFQRAATLIARDATRIIDGEWLQDEGNKPEIETTPAPSRRRSP